MIWDLVKEVIQKCPVTPSAWSQFLKFGVFFLFVFFNASARNIYA